MRPALLMFGYALAVAWLTPALLTRLTARGSSPRLGLAAWLTAMASAVGAAIAALWFLAGAAVSGWPGLAQAVCRSVAGHVCAPTMYRSALFELALTVAAALAVATAFAAAWRYGRGVQRAQARARAHGQAARIAGRAMTPAPQHAAPQHAAPHHSAPQRAVVLDAPQPAAYCVPGRPATIVLTTAALAILDADQLTAVLAHERAHLAGRHHLLTGLTRGLAAVFPAVPLFARGPLEVARLAELRADDAAARRSGRRTLVAALLAMGTGAAVPAAALAATGGATAVRVQRLLDPPGRTARGAVALMTVTLLLAAASAAIPALAA
ncbi:MAG TPA: M56 family metallopeptidase [Streptosporangiaceae bacterium]|nr:M56 family metallopeptidase [Streptosporangiaceae bacterium]